MRTKARKEPRKKKPRKYAAADLQVCVTREKAYTLTEATSREPVGCAVNMKEDKETATRRTITVVESVAEILLTLA